METHYNEAWVIEGEEQAKRFIDAWEAAEKDKLKNKKEPEVHFRYAKGVDDLKRLAALSKKTRKKL